MLTRRQMDLLWSIEIACRRCIRAAKYFDVVSRSEDNLWVFTQNCYGGICVIHWCQVFGSRSELTHYSHVFDGRTVSASSLHSVSKRLQHVTGMSEKQYLKFWKEVKDARNKFLVHKECNSSDRPVFPDLGLLTRICLEMRDIVHLIITSEDSEDPGLQREIQRSVKHYTNARYLSDIDGELHQLASVVSVKKG